MDSEQKIIIAFVFKRSGKQELSFSQFYLTLSMDLNWFTPEYAKDFVNNAIENKLLTKKDDLIKPGFEYEKTVIPLGFHPSKKPSELKKENKPVEKKDAVTAIIKLVAEKTNKDEHTILENIKEIEKERNISQEIAALIVGKEYDIKLDKFFDEIESKLFRENKE